jgi:hypothetical protein
MGSVEAAAEELPDGTTRVVALKRILRAGTGASDAPRVEMFLRESRLTTLLDHPNVVRSLAYGETDGELFLAMEYVAGEPLSRLLAVSASPTSPSSRASHEAADRAERLPLPVIAYILAEACEGLHAAHELRGLDGEPLGVVHRDISPQNVMVGYDGTVKLLDFGVAKIDLLDCAARTKTGEVKGKTAYMSPEQAMGEVIDRRSDLYSMGTVLYECVTGRRMWGAGTDLDVLRKLALEDPPSLADAALDVPPKVATLFARLVERDRAKRPSTADELAVALREIAATSVPGGQACVDAASLRAAMSRLFPGERERRETALAKALASETPEGAIGTLLPSISPGAGGATGESGPVFITHHALASQAQGRRRPGLLASVAAAMLVCAVGGLALYHRAPSATERPRSAAQTSPLDGTRPAPVASVTSLPSDIPPTLPAANAATPELAPRPGQTSPAFAVQTGKTKPMIRRGLVPLLPHVGPTDERAPAASSAGGAPAVPSAARAPTRAPEPPDVDPTPF